MVSVDVVGSCDGGIGVGVDVVVVVGGSGVGANIVLVVGAGGGVVVGVHVIDVVGS